MTDSRQEVFAAADVCYLRCGGARAAALTAGDAAFSAVQGEWTLPVPAVLPYRPGEFFLREPPPLRTVLAPVATLACWSSTATLTSIPAAAPAWARMHTRRSASRSSTWPRPGSTRPATRVGSPGNSRADTDREAVSAPTTERAAHGQGRHAMACRCAGHCLWRWRAALPWPSPSRRWVPGRWLLPGRRCLPWHCGAGAWRPSLVVGLVFGAAFFVPLISWLVNVAWYVWAALAVAEMVSFAALTVGQRLLLRLRA